LENGLNTLVPQANKENDYHFLSLPEEEHYQNDNFAVIVQDVIPVEISY